MPCVDKHYRYLWFELDVSDDNQHQKVLDFFKASCMDVLWHRTMNGYHYITMDLMPVMEYNQYIDYLKTEFDNMTFSYSLRIVPNKWVDEEGIWYHAGIEEHGSNHLTQLRYILKALNQRYYFNYNRTIPDTVLMLQNMFWVSRYEFKGALKAPQKINQTPS